MDIDEHLELLESKNKRLFGLAHTFCIVIAISVIAIILAFNLPVGLAGILAGISAFFIFYHYAAFAVKKTNARITLLETKYKNLGNDI